MPSMTTLSIPPSRPLPPLCTICTFNLCLCSSCAWKDAMRALSVMMTRDICFSKSNPMQFSCPSFSVTDEVLVSRGWREDGENPIVDHPRGCPAYIPLLFSTATPYQTSTVWTSRPISKTSIFSLCCACLVPLLFL